MKQAAYELPALRKIEERREAGREKVERILSRSKSNHLTASTFEVLGRSLPLNQVRVVVESVLERHYSITTDIERLTLSYIRARASCHVQYIYIILFLFFSFYSQSFPLTKEEFGSAFRSNNLKHREIIEQTDLITRQSLARVHFCVFTDCPKVPSTWRLLSRALLDISNSFHSICPWM